MTDILVDSNVILDILTEDPQWFEWSAQTLAEHSRQGNLANLGRSPTSHREHLRVAKTLDCKQSIEIGTAKMQSLRHIFWVPLCPRNFQTTVDLLDRRFHGSRTNRNRLSLEIFVVDDAVAMIFQILAELAGLFQLAVTKKLLGSL